MGAVATTAVEEDEEDWAASESCVVLERLPAALLLRRTGAL